MIISKKRNRLGNYIPIGRKKGTATLTVADLHFLRKYNLMEYWKEGDNDGLGSN